MPMLSVMIGTEWLPVLESESVPVLEAAELTINQAMRGQVWS